ncbi:cordon-bleu protein-like 1 [Pelodytes ibericus]
MKVWTLLCCRKKSKGKAPLPPGEAGYVDDPPSSPDSTGTLPYSMEQKENFIDRDIELTVLLPGERTTTTIVNGSKPMMDLLILLCAQYHLNPSTYTIDLISADNNRVKFKPNTPIGMLEVEKVVLKSKIPDERNRKAGPIVPEQTVRVVINYKKTQKTVMRVSPHASLQDLIPSICSKCEFDPLYTVLLKDYQSQQPLDVSRSLAELGLRELYALDSSRATSPRESRAPPLQESCQNQETKQNDDKRFFSFFRRSKKKRDQTSSAPATPLLSNARPTHMIRANTVSKSYDSSTLPSDVPKKRRAPLPPMHPTQHVTHDLTRGQMRTSSCVVKSVSEESSVKILPGIERSRTGSLQLGSSSPFNSSLRRTKRKAPLPPSPPPKTLQDGNDENSNEIDPVSEKTIQSESVTEKEIHELTTTSAEVRFEDNLQEVEDEEVDSETNPIPISSDRSIVAQEIETHNNSSVSDAESLSSRLEEETMVTVCGSSTDEAVSDRAVLQYEITGQSENVSPTQTIPPEVAKNLRFETKEIQVDSESLSLPQEAQNESSPVVKIETAERLAQTCTEKGNTQDSAVQTNFYNDVDVKELPSSPDSYLVPPSIVDYVTSEGNSPSLPQTVFTEQQGDFLGKEQGNLESVELRNNLSYSNESVQTQTVIVKGNTIESSATSPSKTYQQNSEPKPKPSNELTRDYLPKIGMTTYKIVPQRSFDVERYVECGSPKDDRISESLFLNQELQMDSVMKSTPPLSSPVESMELSSVVRNGNYIPQHRSAEPLSPVSNSSTQANQRHILALTRSLSSAPQLRSDSVPEFKPKPNVTGSVKAPSSFYLQMQRRASGMYVTSAIAKSAKSSDNTTEQTLKFNEPFKHNSQLNSSTSHSQVDRSQPPFTQDEKEKATFVDRSYVANYKDLETINDRHIEAEKETTTSNPTFLMHSRHSEVNHDFGLSDVDKIHSDKVKKLSLDILAPLEEQRSKSEQIKSGAVAPVKAASKPSELVLDCRSVEVSPTSVSQTLHSLNSPTGQPVTLSLQKLRTFATPRPFLSSNPSFSSSGTSVVKRSQSFTSSTSPVSHPLKVDITSGWSSVDSPAEIENESLFSSVVSHEESVEDAILTPALKYRVHSPPSSPEKKTAVPVHSSDPEFIRQSFLAAIRSGEAAANLKRIKIRTNTISINGRSQISHSLSTETQHSA